jgi:hypothetical protein
MVGRVFDPTFADGLQIRTAAGVVLTVDCRVVAPRPHRRAGFQSTQSGRISNPSNELRDTDRH